MGLLASDCRVSVPHRPLKSSDNHCKRVYRINATSNTYAGSVANASIDTTAWGYIGAHRKTLHRCGNGVEHGRHIIRVWEPNVHVHARQGGMLKMERRETVSTRILCAAQADRERLKFQGFHGSLKYLCERAGCTAIVGDANRNIAHRGQGVDPIGKHPSTSYIDVVVCHLQGQPPDVWQTSQGYNVHDAAACIVVQFTPLQCE